MFHHPVDFLIDLLFTMIELAAGFMNRPIALLPELTSGIPWISI